MPPALSGLIPTMGPDAAGGNWSRALRPLPAGKKSLSKFGPTTSPPKRLLLEKRRRARLEAEAEYDVQEPAPQPRRSEGRSSGSPTRLAALPTTNRMATLPPAEAATPSSASQYAGTAARSSAVLAAARTGLVDTSPSRRSRTSRESLASAVTVVPSVAVDAPAALPVAAIQEDLQQPQDIDASERVGEELYSFLSDAKLLRYIPKLRDVLGAQTVADLLELDEGDMEVIGLRKLEVRRLERCLEEYAAVRAHNPPIPRNAWL